MCLWYIRESNTATECPCWFAWVHGTLMYAVKLPELLQNLTIIIQYGICKSRIKESAYNLQGAMQELPCFQNNFSNIYFLLNQSYMVIGEIMNIVCSMG